MSGFMMVPPPSLANMSGPRAGGNTAAAALNARIAARDAAEQRNAAIERAERAAAAERAASQLPKRRIAYLIPPPSEAQPPPFLVLPSSLDPDKAARSKRGNPNPLIILAEDDSRTTQSSYSSNLLEASGSTTARRAPPPVPFKSTGPSGNTNSANRRRSTSTPLRKQSTGSANPPNQTHAQRHPEHTLGISALAIDTSTIIDSSPSSSSPSRKRTPAGILYSGGRDGLVAAWELGLPLKPRDSRAYFRYRDTRLHNRNSYDGGSTSFINTSGRSTRKYRPKWAEDSYDSPSTSDDDDQASNSDNEIDEPEVESLANAEARSSEYFSGSSGVSQSYSRNPYAKHLSNGLHLDVGLGRPSLNGRRGSSIADLNLTETKDTSSSNLLPYEHRWQVDRAALSSASPDAAFGQMTFRQAHRGHTDWVNDLLLCNLNQTVISASSDRFIRAWNPHDPHRSMLPAQLGSHTDYVRCLAHSRHAGWLASGGFDKRLKIWDIHQTRPVPLLEYTLDHSVYAVGTNTLGSIIACGSPERLIRVYDPRTTTSANSASQTNNMAARLVGHADNVRAILVSEDGKHLLSASSDATVKLWSLAMQRCLFTFTHHADAVWSLFSSQPHLETFYSGDRAGTVCKVDFAGTGDIASEGECVILLRNRHHTRSGIAGPNDGINRIVAVDDTFLWTASGSSSISRWTDVQPKAQRQVRHQPPRSISDGQRLPSSLFDVGTSVSSQLTSTTMGVIGNSQQQQANRDFDTPAAEPGINLSSLQRTVSNERSVAFASAPLGKQRSASGGPTSPISAQRPSSLRSGMRQGSANMAQDVYSSSPTGMTIIRANNTAPAVARQNDDRSLFFGSGTSALSPVNELDVLSSTLEKEHTSLSLNGIPLESLVPLFAGNTYIRPAGYGFRGESAGGHGYSASVLSLHRSSSRVLPSTSPFGPGFGSATVTPPSSSLSAPRPPTNLSSAFASPSSHYMRSHSPLPSSILGPMHKPASIAEESDELPFTSASRVQYAKSDAYVAAYRDFEDRESALDGTPLRTKPDAIIKGRPGLIRAELLNDRRTVISLDTVGEVAVWDIVLGACIGRFASKHMQAAMQKAAAPSQEQLIDTSESNGDPRSAEHVDAIDVLDFVRLQIEGEAAVPAWCSVDTKIGSLMVYISQDRAFDAEVYVDEAGVPTTPDHKVDQRLNLGKWVLRNLLDGYIQERTGNKQSRKLSSSVSSIGSADSSASVDLKSAPTARRPSHISIGESTRPNIVDSNGNATWSTLFGSNNGFSVALATPALTPAVLPGQADLAAQLASPRLLSTSLAASVGSVLDTIPASPFVPGTAPPTPGSVASRAQENDYFSQPKLVSDASSGKSTPKPTLPAIPAGPSPAKSGKLNRFKSFGKRDAKRESQVEPLAATDEREERPMTQQAPDKYSHLSTSERMHARVLDNIFAQSFQPSPWSDTPQIQFASDMPIMVGEESVEVGAWANIYRGLVSGLAADANVLDQQLPAWALEFALLNITAVKDAVKIAFVLEPYQGSDKAGLDALPSGNARLSATRMLRMRKACHYVAEKLELESWKQRQQYQAAVEAHSGSNGATLSRSHTRASLSSGSSSTNLALDGSIQEPSLLPEDEVEILCNDKPIPLNITLAACAKYCYGSSGDIQLYYRRRAL